MSRRMALRMAGLALPACAAAMLVLPARWIMAVLPADWPLAVVDARGTLWSGSATVAVGAPARRRTLPEPVQWRLSFEPGPRLLVSHPWLGGPVGVSPSWRGIRISAQTLQLPAAVLATLDARIAAIGPGGELSVKWPATFVGPAGQPAGARLLEVEWRGAASALAPVRPLGDYALALKQGRGGRADLTLATKQGPLLLDGAGTLDAAGVRFEGTAQADPAADDRVHAGLRDLLAALGPRKDKQALLRFR